MIGWPTCGVPADRPMVRVRFSADAPEDVVAEIRAALARRGEVVIPKGEPRLIGESGPERVRVAS